MTTEALDRAIDGIGPDLIEEAARCADAPVRRHPHARFAAAAAAIVFCTVIVLWTAARTPRVVSDPAPESGRIGGGAQYGGDPLYGIASAPAQPDGAPAVRGTPFTEEEITSLIEENKEIIACTLSAEYNRFGEEVQICTQGYCHVMLGEESCVDLDYITLPVCMAQRIVGSVEVFRHNGELLYTISAGGDRWDRINEALAYADRIAFVFAGALSEAAVAPDDTLFEITQDAAARIPASYALLATEYNTFSRSVLRDESRCIRATAADASAPSDGNAARKAGVPGVTLIGTLQEQMGKEPLRATDEEAAILIEMLRAIVPEPVEAPDPMQILIGGGYILEIEGEAACILLGGRYLQIGGNYYYDAAGVSDALMAQIGRILYAHYGEP